MESNDNKSTKIYLKFIEHYVPSFKLLPIKSEYRFCVIGRCAECAILEYCTTLLPRNFPTLSKEIYKKALKNNPEYRI